MLTVVGLSHRTAPVELRERVAVSAEELTEALQDLGQGVILSTCNRTEVYLPDGPAPGRRFFAGRLGPAAVDPSALYQLSGEAAVRHLFAVAASLDSMVLGEAQILGQVRAALAAAEAQKTADPVLARAFREAIRVGKRARAETFVGRHAISVSFAAVELARSVFGRLDGCRALVVGAGEMGELTARTLAGHGVGVVAVANRTPAHAAGLAARFGGRALGLDELVPAMNDADIVISSTDAPSCVIGAAEVTAATAGRGDRPLFVIDIAVPRDVDPTVRDVPGVFLYDIDDLKSLCDHNRTQRQREVHRVQQIIDAETARFAAWWRSRQAVPTVVALRARAEQVRQEELAEALGKLRHLDAADRATVAALTRAIVNKLLHQPTVRLKARASATDDAPAQVLSDLFDL
jgi:glutamyl-tRNA reductase